MNKYIIPSYNRISREKVGAKAKNLMKLMSIPHTCVPEFFVLTTDVHREILLKRGQKHPILFKEKDFNLPSPLRRKLRTLLSDKFKDKKLVIRSSALWEDTPFLTFAGQYASFLGIDNNYSQVIKAIRLCYNSLFSKNAQVYSQFANRKIAQQLMAIIIQEMAPVKISGVMFTVNPVSEDKQKIAVEFSKGLGDNLTSGNIKPIFKEIDKLKTQKDPLLEKIRQTTLNVEKLFGEPQDVEWGYDTEEDRFYLFQSRPISFIKSAKTSPFRVKGLPILCTGRTASKGLIEGRLKIIENTKDLKRAKEKDILIAKGRINKDYIAILKDAGGLVFGGGILSHFGVIMRELNKPCLGHVDNIEILEKFENKHGILDARKKEGYLYLHS